MVLSHATVVATGKFKASQHPDCAVSLLDNCIVIRSRGLRFSLIVFTIELLVRVALILTYPDNYSMDAYQRWGGREHLLIQDWLPATQ